MKSLLLSLLLIVALAPAAVGGTFYNAIVLGTGYVGGPGAWDPETGMWPDPAVPMWIVGPVTEFGAPFDPILPGDGSFEVTYSFDALAYDYGALVEDFQCTAFYFLAYNGGTFRVYLDDTPDADFTNPATFRDGVLLLEAASCVSIGLATMVSLCPGDILSSHDAHFQFTGGTWFDRVSNSGTGYQADNKGAFSTDIPEPMRTAGFLGQTHSFVHLEAPVAVEETTWGRIKALYVTQP